MSKSRRAGVYLTLFAGSLLCSCGSDPLLTTPNGLTLSRLEIKVNGAAIKSRPDMIDICKGFLMSKKSFAEFFTDATYVKKDSPADEFAILPCYASGTVSINDTPYQWVIHSGGIGEFSSKEKQFLKVCGKDCCEKIAGMC
jgi:hypothetical protein